ncbi:MAG: EAL domain-containing protein [Cyanobacteria bacterium]|nr:EAL domain-containing protein [Cyanobacteriota bacterium]
MKRQASLLVVDDNENNRDVLARRLRQGGYLVSMACDGAEALAAIEQGSFDLVLLDVEMPGISGLEVLATLREQYTHAQLPIIMVTARSSGDDVVEALRLGANDYVTKPIDFPVAVARIDTHLAHKWAVADLRDSEERYALAVQGANDGLWDWNLTTGEVYWSPRWRSILGLNEEEVGASADEWLLRVHPEDIEGVRAALTNYLAGAGVHFESEHRVRHRDETYRWVRCRGAAVRTEAGVASRLAGSLTDITEAKLADALTGLPNRLLFVDLVDRALKRTERRAEYTFAILALSLDRFRVVHDSLGPLAADQLLVAVARRLQSSLRATDIVSRDEPGFTLARLGGDEFMVLVDDIADASDAALVADRLRQCLEYPFDVDGHQVFASARIGIAASSSGYTRADDILRDAAIALTRATVSSAPYEIFDPAMRQRAITRLQFETDLRNAIDDQAFEMHYQPIIALKSGRIAGFEALLRWRHPARGLVPPADFIAVAEDTGMILDIGRLTLAESCRQMAAWLADFGAAAPQVMCANVSTKQLAYAGLMTDIAATLRTTGLLAENLKLEITESAFINDVPSAQSTLNHARAMGIGWSLDDFGTGFSSLSFLHRLQVTTVKVDRSFVAEIGMGGSGSEMVRAIVGLAHTLGMDVVAEGVETAEQATALRNLGCEYAQGYFFSKAVDNGTAARLIETQPWQTAAGTQHLVQ